MISPLILSVILINLFYSTTTSALLHRLPTRQTKHDAVNQQLQQYISSLIESFIGGSSPFFPQMTDPGPTGAEIQDGQGQRIKNDLNCEDRSVVPPRPSRCLPPEQLEPQVLPPGDSTPPGTRPDNNSNNVFGPFIPRL